MPSDKPDDDMNNPAFSPRQLAQLDERFEAAQRRTQADLEAAQRRTQADLDERFEAAHRRLHADLALLVNSILESWDSKIAAVDEQYKDLPGRVANIENEQLPVRVTKLEAAVFPPPKPHRRRRGS